jgi:hypothetical protein
MNYVLKDLTLHTMQVSLSRGMVHYVSSAKERLASANVSSASSTHATVVGLCGIQIQNNLRIIPAKCLPLEVSSEQIDGKNRNKKHKVGKR